MNKGNIISRLALFGYHDRIILLTSSKEERNKIIGLLEDVGFMESGTPCSFAIAPHIEIRLKNNEYMTIVNNSFILNKDGISKMNAKEIL